MRSLACFQGLLKNKEGQIDQLYLQGRFTFGSLVKCFMSSTGVCQTCQLYHQGAGCASASPLGRPSCGACQVQGAAGLTS